MINGETNATTSDVEFARELVDFASAIASRDEQMLVQHRQKLLDAAGWEVVVDAAAVAGNFQRMVRIADATGIPIDARSLPLMNKAAEELNLRRFESSKNTPEISFGQKLLAPVMRKLGPTLLKLRAKANN
jgi:hypothetical protein